MAQLTLSITGKVRSCLFLLAALTIQGPAVARLVMAKAGTGRRRGGERFVLADHIRFLGGLLKEALDAAGLVGVSVRSSPRSTTKRCAAPTRPSTSTRVSLQPGSRAPTRPPPR